MFVDCVPENPSARGEWETLLNVADGRLSNWRLSSTFTWQQLCNIAWGKTHPSGTVSSMVASADAVDSALRSLHNLDVVHVDQCLLDDIFLLRKVLCVCLMHKSSVQFVTKETV